mmetsp:Transcript_2150/g.3653  ORF Transcript_2150/g.3653 Transcript_2150/m.3653 type:complete len:179 (+) Transcript_2150:46-582(+)
MGATQVCCCNMGGDGSQGPMVVATSEAACTDNDDKESRRHYGDNDEVLDVEAPATAQEGAAPTKEGASVEKKVVEENPARQADAEEPGSRDYIVTVYPKGNKIGMVFGVFKNENNVVRVRTIREGGSIWQWNADNPSNPVSIGDTLLKVNEATTAEGMLKASAEAPGEVKLHLRRVAR